MSLQVWMPLNGDLHNQGLDNSGVFTISPTYGAGKIGAKAMHCDVGVSLITFNNLIGVSEFSIAYWLYIDSSVTNFSNYADFWEVQMTSGNTTSVARDEFRTTDTTYIGMHAVHIVKDATIGNNTNVYYSFGNRNTAKDKWCHIVLTKNADYCDVYENGIRYGHLACSNIESSPCTLTGKVALGMGGCKGAYLNDFRIYDHCLSPMEIKELAKGLVLHYPLNRQGWGQENLLIGTHMDSTDRAGWVSNSSTDWTKYFRYYNGSASIHSFANGEDTITLNSASNLGICFVRKATDINLDSSSYYTLSCEAKSTQTAKQMCIGLSYYNNSNSWVWRGGSNGQSFTAPNKWQKFTLTFKPDADTQYICYCFTVVGVANGTDTWTIRNCKLEKNSIATPWCPNSSDALATTMGLNSTTEYDCSGFCNNGTRTGTFTWTSDTPKYAVSTNFAAVGQVINNTSPIHLSNEFTIAWWGKINSWKKNWEGMFLLQNNATLNAGTNTYDIMSALHASTANSMSLTICQNGSSYAFDKYKWTYTLGVWAHYTCTYKAGIVTLYQNGTSIYTETITDGSSNDYYYRLGYRANACDCQISDFRIYATALSASDVKSLYQNSAYIDSSGNVYGAVHTEV